MEVLSFVIEQVGIYQKQESEGHRICIPGEKRVEC